MKQGTSFFSGEVKFLKFETNYKQVNTEWNIIQTKRQWPLEFRINYK